MKSGACHAEPISASSTSTRGCAPRAQQSPRRSDPQTWLHGPLAHPCIDPQAKRQSSVRSLNRPRTHMCMGGRGAYAAPCLLSLSAPGPASWNGRLPGKGAGSPRAGSSLHAARQRARRQRSKVTADAADADLARRGLLRLREADLRGVPGLGRLGALGGLAGPVQGAQRRLGLALEVAERGLEMPDAVPRVQRLAFAGRSAQRRV
mmetsp:Transcript_104991/g.306740  ORF Transcript_104991/g.306740 Transcript_104991/m.306740 type:complete len:206 (-) Transcript_104991:924-1541(-)